MRTVQLTTFALLVFAALPVLALPIGPSSADTPAAAAPARPHHVQKRGGNADPPVLPAPGRGRTAANAIHPDVFAHKEAVLDLVNNRDFAALHRMFKPSTVGELWPPSSVDPLDPAGRAARRKGGMFEKKPLSKAPAPERPVRDIEPPKFNAGLDKDEFAPAQLLKDLGKFTPEK